MYTQTLPHRTPHRPHRTPHTTYLSLLLQGIGKIAVGIGKVWLELYCSLVGVYGQLNQTEDSQKQTCVKLLSCCLVKWGRMDGGEKGCGDWLLSNRTTKYVAFPQDKMICKQSTCKYIENEGSLQSWHYYIMSFVLTCKRLKHYKYLTFPASPTSFYRQMGGESGAF